MRLMSSDVTSVMTPKASEVAYAKALSTPTLQCHY